MLHNSFYFLLNMSIISAVLILILLGIRFVFSKYIPKKAVHYLWGIVIFRLLFPAALPSRFSLLNLIGDKTKSVMFPRPSAVMPNMSTMNTIKGARQYFPMEYKTDALESFLRISGVAWACISILFILICVTMYLSTSRHLRRSSHLIESGLLYQCMARLKLKKRIRLYESERIATPVVLGILNPSIIIPKGVPDDVLEYVLLHELHHITSCDNLLRLISIFAVCIHWFNPLAWVFLQYFGRDMELACDEKVLKFVGVSNRKPYACALTSLAAKQQSALTSFGSVAVRERIVNITYYRKLPIVMTVMTFILCIFITLLLITNPLM